MKKLFYALTAIAAMAAMHACSGGNKADDREAAPKTLVLYYSQTGATKAVAEEIAGILGADIEAIEAVNPYDGDYMATIQRCMQERADSVLPEIKPIEADSIAPYFTRVVR